MEVYWAPLNWNNHELCRFLLFKFWFTAQYPSSRSLLEMQNLRPSPRSAGWEPIFYQDVRIFTKMYGYWYFRNTGVDFWIAVIVTLVAESCLTLFDPLDCGPPESSVLRISQARILEQVLFSTLVDLPDNLSLFFFFFSLPNFSLNFSRGNLLGDSRWRRIREEIAQKGTREILPQTLMFMVTWHGPYSVSEGGNLDLSKGAPSTQGPSGLTLRAIICSSLQGWCDGKIWDSETEKKL